MKDLKVYIKKLYTYSGNILFLNQLGMVLSSFLDGLGILMLIPLLNLSGILQGANSSSSFLRYVSFLNRIPQGYVLPLVLLLYVVLVTGQNLLDRNLTIRDIAIHQGFLNDLKEEVYQQLLFVKWEFYLNTRNSNLINTLTRDINRVSIGLKMFMQLMADGIFTLIQVGIAFYVSVKVSLLVVVFGIGLAFFAWRFVKKAQSLGGETTPLTRQYLAGITDYLNGIRDIKTNTLEKSSMSWLKVLDKKMLKQQVDMAKLNKDSRVSYEIALVVRGLRVFNQIYNQSV